ncbi:uncharacterized protein LOC119371460 [Jatropha curcas]|uniref:uncharacterized protein LOC119371460 n=1 Tax=Jatropha curcas TaxID=180498 RepID=UPI0018934639|nr:uncharacterized protein LOC119371460 [Jatropha curcas]
MEKQCFAVNRRNYMVDHYLRLLLKDRFVGHLQPGQYITLHMDGLAAMKVLVSEGETKRKFLDEGWKEVVDYVLTIEGARWPKFYYYPGANYKLVFAVDDLNPLTLGRPIQNNQDKEDGIQDLPTGFAVTVKDMTIKHHTVMTIPNQYKDTVTVEISSVISFFFYGGVEWKMNTTRKTPFCDRQIGHKMANISRKFPYATDLRPTYVGRKIPGRKFFCD